MRSSVPGGRRRWLADGSFACGRLRRVGRGTHRGGGRGGVAREEEDLDATVAHRARRLPVSRVQRQDETKAGRGHGAARDPANLASLWHQQRSLRLQQRVQPVQHRGGAQVRVVQQHPVASLHGLQQDAVHPFKCSANAAPVNVQSARGGAGAVAGAGCVPGGGGVAASSGGGGGDGSTGVGKVQCVGSRVSLEGCPSGCARSCGLELAGQRGGRGCRRGCARQAAHGCSGGAARLNLLKRAQQISRVRRRGERHLQAMRCVRGCTQRRRARVRARRGSGQSEDSLLLSGAARGRPVGQSRV